MNKFGYGCKLRLILTDLGFFFVFVFWTIISHFDFALPKSGLLLFFFFARPLENNKLQEALAGWLATPPSSAIASATASAANASQLCTQCLRCLLSRHPLTLGSCCRTLPRKSAPLAIAATSAPFASAVIKIRRTFETSSPLR